MIGDIIIETKIILGVIVVLVLAGGVLGCSYVFNNPTSPSVTTQVPAAAGDVDQQNTVKLRTKLTTLPQLKQQLKL